MRVIQGQEGSYSLRQQCFVSAWVPVHCFRCTVKFVRAWVCLLATFDLLGEWRWLHAPAFLFASLTPLYCEVY